MGQLFRRGAATIAAAMAGAMLVWSSAMAQGEPPARVARLAYTNGPVSFHDNQQSAWTPAVVNTPLSSGSALWTEPGARSEVSLAGTRIRMEGATELDLLAVDDTQTRLQLPQGRIDVKSFAMDPNQPPYEIATPRGTVRLLQQGDYYVEAGSTEDPTRLGVRSGAAQIQGLNGEVLAVRPNEVAEVTGDGSTLQLRTIQSPPPAPPAYWANRDRQVVYDPPQYLSADMTGYEDLNGYGDWINDGSYGRVWVPRAVPVGWAPYRTGHWAYVEPWGWTWIDDQPWGFAPYHYGRWANRNNRWMWVPPERDVRPVYAPALVAFVGGAQLAATLGNRSAAPVGWFPLGPREAYVPPYSANRDYYLRLNRSARIEDRILDERWQHAERREAFIAGRNAGLMNQRYATVVPTSAFVGSQPVMRSALQVRPQVIAAAPVAAVAAPPAPSTAPTNAPVAKTALAAMPTLAKPVAVSAPTGAPGPRIATTEPNATRDNNSRPAAPPLTPRQPVAPPAAQPHAAPQPLPRQATPPVPPPQQARPAETARPQATPAPQPQQAKPIEPPRQQATPHPQTPAPAAPPQQARPEPPRQPRPQAAPPPPRPAPQQQEGHAAPPQQHQAAPPPQQRQAAPQPQHQAAPQPQPQHQAQPPQQAQAPQTKKDDKK